MFGRKTPRPGAGPDRPTCAGAGLRLRRTSHGSMLVALYAPRGKDAQTPHTQDELYLVARGSGWFVNGDARHPCGVGDVLFVPAGVVHRFEQFTDNFAVWVVFYGPEGGESRSPADAGPA
ncbi:MAG: cupin domain-containing protein [Bacillati bacterium ANGP1]|uniref:Cupin domain-containing protein n=1 Tax=Candidatus Segetimicrobium genomatis TaxID=2569760 RepID=A0A537JHZ1_9BACT|nr:MAG: cupin domain-containing protein [Terrabacteria group bacterium ANGP1]